MPKRSLLLVALLAGCGSSDSTGTTAPADTNGTDTTVADATEADLGKDEGTEVVLDDAGDAAPVDSTDGSAIDTSTVDTSVADTTDVRADDAITLPDGGVCYSTCSSIACPSGQRCCVEHIGTGGAPCAVCVCLSCACLK
jgi:hypothetical protein